LMPSLSYHSTLRFFAASRWFDVPLFLALDVDVRLQSASSDLLLVLRVQILEPRSRLPRPALLGPASGARADSASALLARHASSFCFSDPVSGFLRISTGRSSNRQANGKIP